MLIRLLMNFHFPTAMVTITASLPDPMVISGSQKVATIRRSGKSPPVEPSPRIPYQPIVKVTASLPDPMVISGSQEDTLLGKSPPAEPSPHISYPVIILVIT